MHGRCVQIISVYISVFNVKKKHDVGPYISSGYKMILSKEQQQETSKMKAFFNQAYRGYLQQQRSRECWMHTNNLPMGVIIVGSVYN